MKRIALVGTVGVPAKYGGYETTAENLEKLGHYPNVKLYIYCSKLKYDHRPRFYKCAELIYMPFKANGWQSVIYDLLSIVHASFKCDCILLFGGSAGIFVPFIQKVLGVPIFINTDGIEWQRPKWGFFAKLYLLISEKILGKFHNRVISDSHAIADYYQTKYLKSTFVIPYGGDHVKRDFDNEVKKKYGVYAINISRTVPENNIHLIVEAFAKQKKFNLVILGDWVQNKYGKEIYLKYKTCHNIYFLPELYENSEYKNKLRSSADLYIQGHSAGGTSPGLIEAMMVGLPVFSFDTPSNRATTCELAQYFNNSVELTQMIHNVSCKSLSEMSEKLVNFAQIHYRWSVIVEKYYNILINSK